jgi:hypothetical protein
MQYVNLTPHVLNVHRPDGSVMDVAPSGQIARVASRSVLVEIDDDGVEHFAVEYGEVTGLPAPQPGVLLVVSGMVAAAAPRSDVRSPGDLVRGPDGQPAGCRGVKVSLR